MSRSLRIFIGIAIIAAAGIVGTVILRRPTKRWEQEIPTTKTFTLPSTNVKKITLNNGMTLITYKTPQQGKVYLQMAYAVGAASEHGGQRGMAHLIEHMILKGTKKLAEPDFKLIARKYGATASAETSMNYTKYCFDVDKNNWQPFLEIFADTMQNARFEPEHLASEIKAVIHELHMQHDRSDRLVLIKILSSLFPAYHPYHCPSIGFKQDLMTVSVDALKQFYHQHYQPRNATLMVIGDIDEDEVATKVELVFGPLQNTSEPQDEVLPACPPMAQAIHLRCYEDVQKESFSLFWRIPGLADPQADLVPAIEKLLGGDHGSRLNRLLIDEHNCASSVSASSCRFFHGGYFAIKVTPRHGKAEQCRELVLHELAHCINKGFSPAELQHMVKALTISAFKTLQKPSDFATAWFLSYRAHENDETAWFSQLDRYMAITSMQLQAFIAEFLSPHQANQLDLLTSEPEDQAIRSAARKIDIATDKELMARFVRTAPLEQPRYVNQLPAPQPLDISFSTPDRVFNLKNGLTVILCAQHGSPLLRLECAFKQYPYLIKSRDGIVVDVMMSMLSQGSKDFTRAEITNFFQQRGVRYDFSTKGGTLTLLNEDLDSVFDRFAQVLTQPHFSSDALEKIRHKKINQYKHLRDKPDKFALRLLKSMDYGDHPYGWTVEEAQQDLTNLDLATIKKWHDVLVRPNNMLLCVVGEFDLDEMQHTIESAFGLWQSGAAYQPTLPPLSYKPNQEITTKLIRSQTTLAMGGPSPINYTDHDHIALKLLSHICFKSLGSRIYRLREQSGLFYAAHGGWSEEADSERGYDFILTRVDPDATDRAEKSLREVILELAANGVTAEELAAAKQMELKKFLDYCASNKAIAQSMVKLQAYGLGFDYYQEMIRRIHALTLDEINEVAARYCKTEGWSRVRIEP